MKSFFAVTFVFLVTAQLFSCKSQTAKSVQKNQVEPMSEARLKQLETWREETAAILRSNNGKEVESQLGLKKAFDEGIILAGDPSKPSSYQIPSDVPTIFGSENSSETQTALGLAAPAGAISLIYGGTFYGPMNCSAPITEKSVGELLKIWRTNGFRFLRVSKDLVYIIEPGASAATTTTVGAGGGAASGGAATGAAAGGAATVAAGAVAVVGAGVVAYLVYDLVKTNSIIAENTKGWTEAEKADLYKENSYLDNFCRMYFCF